MLYLFDFIITPDDTLQIALERMTKNRKGLLFVCDESSHLVGVISDGDIRRALVGKALLIARVESYLNLDPVTARTVEDGERLLAKHNLLVVPVVDAEGKVIRAVVQGVDQIEVIGAVSDDPTLSMERDQELGAVAIIPARGGSKRIAKKNIAVVAGKPLLAYAIDAAQKAGSVFRVIVSTDDIEIADVARQYGAEVPWLRPTHLAQDNTPSIDVVIHAIEWARKQYGENLQYGVLLEPTAPLRTSHQVDWAVEMLRSSNADSVVSVCEVPHVLNPEELLIIQDQHLKPYIQERTMDTRRLRSQQAPVYVQNGLVYAFRLDMILKKKNLYGENSLPMIVDWNYFLDIDVPSDLALAEYKILQNR